MRRAMLNACAAALSSGAAVPALAVEPITIDFTTMPAFSGPQLVVGDLVITAHEEGSPRNVIVQPGVGLGVEGGLSNARIDRDEVLRFHFSGEHVAQCWFDFSNAADRDGDGVPGEGWIYGFGPGGEWLGGPSISGGLGAYATGLFSGSPMQDARVVGNDGFSVARISFVPLDADVVAVELTQLGTFTTPELTVGELRITATSADGQPGLVQVLNLNGIGVAGGLADHVVDQTEALTYEFLGELPEHVWILFGLAADGDANGTLGELRIHPETPTGRRLPAIASEARFFYMTPILQGAPVRRFTIASHGGDAHSVARVYYTVPRIACPSDMDGDGQVGSSDLAALLGAWGPCP